MSSPSSGSNPSGSQRDRLPPAPLPHAAVPMPAASPALTAVDSDSTPPKPKHTVEEVVNAHYKLSEKIKVAMAEMRDKIDTITSTLAKTLDGIKEREGKNTSHPDPSDDSLTRISSDITRLSSEIEEIKRLVLESNHGPIGISLGTLGQPSESIKVADLSLAAPKSRLFLTLACVALTGAIGFQVWLGQSMFRNSARFDRSATLLLDPQRGVAARADRAVDKWENSTKAIADVKGKLEELSRQADVAGQRATSLLDSTHSMLGTLNDAKSQAEQVSSSLKAATDKIAASAKSFETAANNLPATIHGRLADLEKNTRDQITADKQLIQEKTRLVDALRRQMEADVDGAPVRLLVADTGKTSTGFLRGFLDQILRNANARASANAPRDIQIYLPKGVGLGQGPLTINDQYSAPSPNATVDWKSLNLALLSANLPNKARCVIVCDGTAEPPDFNQEQWRKFGKVDVILLRVTALGGEPAVERIPSWEQFARKLAGVAITVPLPERAEDRNEETGRQIAAVLRGLLDGPLPNPPMLAPSS